MLSCYPVCPTYTEFSLLTTDFVIFADLMDITNGELPTVEEIETVWDLPQKPTEPVRGDEDEETPEFTEAMAKYTEDLAFYAKKEKLLTWYCTEYLTYAVGVETWNNTNKCTKLITDVEKVQQDISGKKKVLIPVTSEAFGQVMFKNCREKWIALWKYRKEHGPKAKPPKYSKTDPTTHIFEGLWSNPRSGQVFGGGWHMDGLQYFKDRLEAVKAVREADKLNGYAKMKHARSLIRTNMEWKPAAKSGKRSAKEANNAIVEGAVLQKRVKIVILDE